MFAKVICQSCVCMLKIMIHSKKIFEEFKLCHASREILVLGDSGIEMLNTCMLNADCSILSVDKTRFMDDSSAGSALGSLSRDVLVQVRF